MQRPGADFARERLPRGVILLLFLGMVLVALLGGIVTARYRQAWLAELPVRLAAAPAEVRPLLSRGKMYATALAGNAAARRDLAYGVVLAGELSPGRLGYYANANTLYQGLDRGGLPEGAQRFVADLAASGVQSELGMNQEAMTSVQNALASLVAMPQEEQLPLRLIAINSQAYLLATIPEADGGNAQDALDLARLMISSRDPLPNGGYASGSAAFMDTLATALYANGKKEQALATQTLALGLADSQGLDIYLHHFDQFTRSDMPEKSRQNQRKNDVQ